MSTPRDASSPRLPSLDGLRMVSIAFVFLGHNTQTSGFPHRLREPFRWLVDAELGVRFFFCISGFLITRLLLEEAARADRVRLGRFYARRALRILPAWALFAAALAVLQSLGRLGLTREQWIATLTFTVDFGGGTWMNGHLWSLAVEEQFYLLWPFAFVALRVHERPRRMWAIFAAVLLLAPLARVAGYLAWLPGEWQWLLGPYSFFRHFDALAIGCAAAFLHERRSDDLRRALRAAPARTLACGLALIAAPHALGVSFLAGWITVPLGWTVQALAFTTLMLQSVLAPELPWWRLLEARAARHLGLLSYSLYLWQQPFSAAPDARLADAWWTAFPGWMLAAYAAALSSYYLCERPLFSLRARLR